MFMSLAQNIFEFAFALILGSLGLRVGFLEVRYFIRTRRSLHWPTVPGIVQKGEILSPGSPKYIRSASFQSKCSYVYTVALISDFLSLPPKTHNPQNGFKSNRMDVLSLFDIIRRTQIFLCWQIKK
jgi:hypothetical protein